MNGPGSLRRRRLLSLAALTLPPALAACGRQEPDRRLRSDAPLPVVPAPAPTPLSLPPVRFPEDEAPHDVLAEWWYYTGHLHAAQRAGEPALGVTGSGSPEEYGFELVFFRGVRGSRPPGYAAHFAVTDLGQRRFVYDQRQDVALNERAAPAPAPPGQAAGSAARPPGIVSYGPPGGGFDLALGGWWMRGRNGRDALVASMPGYAIDLTLEAVKPPALHLGDPPWQPGLISFGPAGYSYYYSRTRMHVAGSVTVDGVPRTVTGEAWMDHQWGDFLVLGGGGWDWFAAQLRDGRDVTFSLIRDASGATILAYGTLVEADGQARHLPPASFEVAATGAWTSPRTRIRYPSGWRVRVPEHGLNLEWVPLLDDQELDTRASTGVIYWEGAVAIRDAASGADAGRGYVELTGYAPGR